MTEEDDLRRALEQATAKLVAGKAALDAHAKTNPLPSDHTPDEPGLVADHAHYIAAEEEVARLRRELGEE